MEIGVILSNIFSFEVLFALVLGVTVAIIMGALPGLSASMAVALLIPVTFGMNPIAGLVMLTGVYTAAIYGGSITAILLHTPGTPSSAATAIDGYELAKKGEGFKAIGVATISSVIGGCISAIALIFLSPPLAQISLKFSSLEYFFLALFGLTIIGSLAGDSMAKGLMGGVLGLFIGTVGLDQMSGIPRFTFGLLPLESGISMVPAMIGMFSISQVMIITEDIIKGKSNIVSGDENLLKGRFLPTFKEFKSLLPTILKSSILGVLVGILPGAGADIGAWLAYNEAKRTSKNPKEFGNGSLVGISASESANNAVTGGALIPLLTLGIPGSSVAAILLGGLMIQGLAPGHDLFEEYAGITYSVMFGFLLANIIMGFIGYLISKQAVKISKVPMTILAPIIVALSTVGAFAIQNSLFDVYIMIAFGVIAYFMRKSGFGTAPTILGIILAPMLEANFRRALVLSKGNLVNYFFSRPISVVLFIMVIVALFAPMIIKKVNNKLNIKDEASIDSKDID
ncbi:MAG: tripartite tricarboxylate transporter permease [Sedimentibacter sp.]|uniref:tripartite tricarboxylate transporter permease n=1 Tax=Sedimentibacter sp. TaxID=1960295 RepID=UPI0031593E47